MTFNSLYKSAIDLKSCWQIINCSGVYLDLTSLSEWLAQLCTPVGWWWSTAWVGMSLTWPTATTYWCSARETDLTWRRFVQRQQWSILARGLVWCKRTLFKIFITSHSLPKVSHWCWLQPMYTDQSHSLGSLSSSANITVVSIIKIFSDWLNKYLNS